MGRRGAGVVGRGGAVDVRVDWPGPFAHRTPATARTATSTPAPITTARWRPGDATARAGAATAAAGMAIAGGVEGNAAGTSAPGLLTATAGGTGRAIAAVVEASRRPDALPLGTRVSG